MLATAAARADWQSDYERGMAAVAAGRAAEAVGLLERAIRERPDPGVVRIGMFRTDYFPHYHLAKAYLALGRHAEAHDTFSQALRGRIDQMPEAWSADGRARLEELRAGLDSRLSRVETLLRERRPGAAAGDVAELQRRVPSDPEEAARYGERIAGVVRQRDGLIADAQAALARGLAQRDAGDHEAARRLLTEAAGVDATSDTARAALAALPTAATPPTAPRADAGPFVQTARLALQSRNLVLARDSLARAEGVDGEAASVRALREEVEEAARRFGAAIGEAERALERGDAGAARAAVMRAEAIDTSDARLDALRARTGDLETAAAAAVVPRPPPPSAPRPAPDLGSVQALIDRQDIAAADRALTAARRDGAPAGDLSRLEQRLAEAARAKAIEGIRQEWQLQHDAAIAALDDATVRVSGPFAAQAYLYLGWAHYARYLSNGGVEGEIPAATRRAIRRALEIDPAVQPAPDELISPRLRRAFEAVRRDTSR